MSFDPGLWLFRRGRWQRLGIAILAGAVMTLGHAPIGLPWVLFLAVPVLVWLWAVSPTGAAAFWAGWGAGFGYFVTGLHWIGNAFLVDPDKFLWLIPLGVAALPAGLAIFWGLAFWLAKRLQPPGPINGTILLAAILTLAEYARANVLTGFPWALPGYVWIDTPIAQAAAWAGPFGLSFLTLALTGTLLVAVFARHWLAAGTTLALTVGLLVHGLQRVPEKTTFAPDAPVLRIVQPNAPQNEKWVPGKREIFYKRALEATAAAPDAELGPADLVIWPETSVFFLPALRPEEVERIAASAGGAPVIFGGLHAELRDGQETWFNSLFVASPDGVLTTRYDKHHLVPFGEYLPFQGLLSAIGLQQFAQAGRFSPGAGPAHISLPGLPTFAPLICYEAIFPDEIAPGERPDWLLQITNDAWFGSFAGPQQHLVQARFRAIEQGLPFVRAANTGISAVIDSYGLVVVSIPMHNYREIDAKLPPKIEATLYSRWGDALALFMIVIVAIFSVFTRIISHRD